MSDNEAYINICEIIGSITVPLLFFHADVLIATSLPIDGLLQLFLIVLFFTCSVRIGPFLGSLIGAFIIMLED